MTATIDASQRASLLDVEGQLAQWQSSLEIAAEQGAVDEEHQHRLTETLRRLAAAVNDGLAPPIDPDAANEIRERLLRLLTLDPAAHQQPLDVADQALMEAEAIRHIVRDLLDGGPPTGLTAAQALAQISAWVPRLGVGELAQLLGVDRRSISRLRESTAQPERPLLMVWRLVALLHRSWTDEGVVAWFARPRTSLGGRTPADALNDTALEQQLVALARRSRTQRAS